MHEFARRLVEWATRSNRNTIIVIGLLACYTAFAVVLTSRVR